MARVRLSILDLAPIRRGETASDSFAASVALAQRAEELGYRRVWYAEHHNIATIASSATSVLIAHVAAHTRTIRLGAGGIMLPNHAPLPSPSSSARSPPCTRPDRPRPRACPGLRPDHDARAAPGAAAADPFPEDVLELQGYLRAQTDPRRRGHARQGDERPALHPRLVDVRRPARRRPRTPVRVRLPLRPGCPPAAVAAYRSEFRPSEQLDRPYVIAGVNVLAADTTAAAQRHVLSVRRARAVGLFAKQLGITAGTEVSDEQADQVLAAGAAAHVDEMLTYTAAGTPDEVRDYLDDFLKLAAADELMTVHPAPTAEERIRSVTLLAQTMHTATA